MGIASSPQCSISLSMNVSHRMLVKMTHLFCRVLIFLQNGEIFKYHKWFNLMLLQLQIRAFARVTEGC